MTIYFVLGIVAEQAAILDRFETLKEAATAAEMFSKGHRGVTVWSMAVSQRPGVVEQK